MRDEDATHVARVMDAILGPYVPTAPQRARQPVEVADGVARLQAKAGRGEQPVWVLVDEADLDVVGRYSWCASRAGATFYVRARVEGKLTLLHRFLMPGVAMIDHVNGDALDNRRANLRPATARMNCLTRHRGRLARSGFKGVLLCSSGRYEARLCKRSLGRFDTAEEASAAVEAARTKALAEETRFLEKEEHR